MSIRKTMLMFFLLYERKKLICMTMHNIRKTSVQHFIYTVRLLQKKHVLELSLDEEDTLRQFDFHNMHDDFYSKLQNSFLATTIQERVHRFLKICEAIYM